MSLFKMILGVSSLKKAASQNNSLFYKGFNMNKYFQFLSFLLSCSLYCSTLCPATQYSSHPHDQSLLLLALKQSFSINQSNSDYVFYQTPYYYIRIFRNQCQQSYPKTNTWNESTDCCTWDGVTCDRITGNVIELDLSCSQLGGSIHSDSSLFQLPHLQRLNLAWNHIRSSQISMIFGNFSQLAHLNLSGNEFSGQVPFEILKLTELTTLDLSHNAFTVGPDIFKLLLTNFTKLSQAILPDLNIFSSFPKNISSSLEIVQLHGNNLHGKLPQSIFHLPNLKTLDLGGNSQLYGLLPSVTWNSHRTLEWLDLSKIQFLEELPDSIRNLKALKYLDLSRCGFSGPLPKGIFMNMTQIDTIKLSYNRFIGPLKLFPGETKQLKMLLLAHNSFTGTIMSSGLLSLSSLEVLDLYINQMYGHVPLELSSLVNLKFLNLASNNFSGHVDVDIFSNMKQLQGLGLSHNRLSLVSKKNSTLPASIVILWLASCNIKRLEFLRSSPEYYLTDLSANKITEVPSWVWSKWNNIYDLNISYNSISYNREIRFQQITFLDIRSNLFQGQFPQIPASSTVYYILISNNQFSGVIPSSIICSLSNLALFDVSNNSFTGSIPHCIGNMSSYLSVLDLHMNQFEGFIPTNFTSRNLQTLNLHGNHLRGDIPFSLATCVNLKVLDLGNNNLNGSFPLWLGVLPELKVLSLRSNNFHGKINLSVNSSFSKLQILDLSHNQFIGTLSPELFKSFSGLMETDETSEPVNYIGNDYVYYKDSTTLMNKGNEVDLVRILTTWSTIDLSSNYFEGNIPSSVGRLASLRQLNFSNNRLTGAIPNSFENLTSLESLDLSSNQLTGTIPKQLTTLHFLSKLNLAHNHLTGRIPEGPQFQTFESDSYIDNDGLCGIPLAERCAGDEEHVADQSPDSDFFDGFGWRCVLIGYGAGTVLGLWIGFLMIRTETPEWLIIMIYRTVMKLEKKKKITKQTQRKN